MQSLPDSRMVTVMRSHPLPVFISLILWSCGPSTQAVNESDEASRDGWRYLFNGESTDAWRAADADKFPEQGWTTSEGALILNSDEGAVKGGNLITREEYGDFILDWEWKMYTQGGNSGVKYFVKIDSSFDLYGPGLEYQILDDANHEWMLEGKMQPGDYHTLAALYELYPPENRNVNSLGEWNFSRIVAEGNHVEHWLNGAKVLEFERGSEDFRQRVAESKFAKYKKFGEADKGHILLQDHGSKVAFRNIKIKSLK